MITTAKNTKCLATQFAATTRRFTADDHGETMIEYSLIVGFISIAIILTLTSVGVTLRDDVFSVISTVMSSGSDEGG